MSDASDVELMFASRGGDGGAFGEIVDRYRNVLLNFFLRRGVQYEDGLDLAQRVFVRLWRYRTKYTPSAKFTTFLFKLASQESVDFFRMQDGRRRLREHLEHEAWVAESAGTMHGMGESAVGCRPPPSATAMAIAEGDDVRRAVAALPDGMRDVVELGVFQDLPYAEIGSILGIPVGTVKSRMFNALRKLKEILG